MKKISILTVLILLITTSAFAQAPKGFLEGPYILANGGMFKFTYDNNQRTGTRVGNDIEPTVGFNFGWNLKDYFSPELQMRYSTNKCLGTREHIVNVNLNGVYSFIIPQITKSKKFAVIPYLQGGPMFQIAAIPGDPAASDKIITTWGLGFGVGGGVKFLIAEYLFAGVLVQGDFIRLADKYQNISGSQAMILSGGWDIIPGISGLVGVHF